MEGTEKVKILYLLEFERVYYKEFEEFERVYYKDSNKVQIHRK